MFSKLLPYMKWFKLSAGIILLIGAFFIGMKVESWQRDAEIAEIRLQIADDREKVLKQSIEDMATASKNMREASEAAQVIVGKNDEKLNAIAKEIKKFKPLPVDCKPDGMRQQSLERAIDATNNPLSGR